MFTLLIISFVAGILTILAPCVLPVLPVVLAGSISEKQRWYPYLVTLSLAVSVVLFTVILKATTALIDIPQSFWKYLSGGILLALGLVYIFPHAWAWIGGRLGFGRSNTSLDKAQDISSPVLRAIVTGAALGPVFSTCSPTYTLLLATVFPVSLWAGIGYTLVYALGLSLMLTLVAVGGRSLITRFRGVADERGWFKRILGIVFILIGLSIITGLDKKVETYVLDRFDVSGFENSLLDSYLYDESIEMPGEIIGMEMVDENGVAGQAFPIAPEISLTDWIGSEPLTMESLRGKVVLIDFWSFDCFNCQNTRPYLNAWYEKYRDQGLIIIGVHTPESPDETIRESIEAAVKKENIVYPVVIDNDSELWNQYENQFRPALYFVDKRGYVRHSRFGEGDYENSEAVIQALLAD